MAGKYLLPNTQDLENLVKRPPTTIPSYVSYSIGNLGFNGSSILDNAVIIKYSNGFKEDIITKLYFKADARGNPNYFIDPVTSNIPYATTGVQGWDPNACIFKLSPKNESIFGNRGLLGKFGHITEHSTGNILASPTTSGMQTLYYYSTKSEESLISQVINGTTYYLHAVNKIPLLVGIILVGKGGASVGSRHAGGAGGTFIGYASFDPVQSDIGPLTHLEVAQAIADPITYATRYRYLLGVDFGQTYLAPASYFADKSEGKEFRGVRANAGEAATSSGSTYGDGGSCEVRNASGEVSFTPVLQVNGLAGASMNISSLDSREIEQSGYKLMACYGSIITSNNIPPACGGASFYGQGYGNGGDSTNSAGDALISFYKFGSR